MGRTFRRPVQELGTSHCVVSSVCTETLSHQKGCVHQLCLFLFPAEQLASCDRSFHDRSHSQRNQYSHSNAQDILEHASPLEISYVYAGPCWTRVRLPVRIVPFSGLRILNSKVREFGSRQEACHISGDGAEDDQPAMSHSTFLLRP